MLPELITVLGLCAPLISAAEASAAQAGWGGPGGWGGGGGGYGYGGGKPGGPPGGGGYGGGPGGWGGPFGGGGWGGPWGGGPPGGAPGWGGPPPPSPPPGGPPAPTAGPGFGGGPQLPSCFMQTFQASGISQMTDFKQLCAQAAKPGFLVKVSQDICGICKADQGAITFGVNMLPLLQSQCSSYGMALPADVFAAAQQAAQCSGSTAAPGPPGPPGPSGPPGPPGPPGPTQTITGISTMTIRSTLYPNITSPFGGPPPSAVVTTYTTTSTPAGYTPGFTQSPTTTSTRAPTSPIPFTGAASSIALEWWLTASPIVAAVFWAFA